MTGPGDLAWRYLVDLGGGGSFYHRFLEKDVPTGEYRAHFENAAKQSFGRAVFRIEAYRVPQFEVRLHGPDVVPLYRDFEVGLTFDPAAINIVLLTGSTREVVCHTLRETGCTGNGWYWDRDTRQLTEQMMSFAFNALVGMKDVMAIEEAYKG